MQTFLPKKSFLGSARVLDYKRLGKQRVEAKQILDLVEGRVDNHWKHHPAVRMWWDYNQCLRFYYNTMVLEWERRSFENNMPLLDLDEKNYHIPPWLWDPRLTLSHRSNLLRKNPEYYGQFGWKDADPGAPYWWPVPMKTPHLQKYMLEYWGR